MKYPAMNKRPKQAVITPDFSGGLNLRDGISQIADNQLTDCLNMWFKDGVLKTRPKEKNKDTTINGSVPAEETPKYKNHDIIIKGSNGYKYGLFSLVFNSYIFFYAINQNRIVMYKSINDGEITSNTNYFVTYKNNYIYVFLENGKVYRVLNTKAEDSFKLVDPLDYYIPTVATNCFVFPNEKNKFSGDMLETENAIGKYHKMVYSTANPDISTEQDMTYHNINYSVDTSKHPLSNYADLKVKAKYISPVDGKTYTHSVTLGGDGFGKEANLGEDGLQMRANPRSISFYKTLDDEEPVKISPESNFLRNNLEITFPVIRTETTNNSVFGANTAVWFGGGAGGLSGGSRLFVCGGVSDTNIVSWSHRDDPLYWPENNWFEVGASAEPVIGFGKQENMLVIFKENETYYTQYYQNQNIESTDLTNQTVIDYNAASVYFPLIQLNPNIGCDCPDTVQLCRNRLVWAHSNGKVYSLVSANNYSERTIYEVGEMVFNRLSKEDNLKSAVAYDWENHYVLSVGNHLYLMDYNSSGYQYAYSYQKQEDGNARIPWYYWEIDNKNEVMFFVFQNNLLFFYGEYREDVEGFDGEQLYCINLFCLPLTVNTFSNAFDIKIHAKMQTKLFDFNAPRFYKNVDSVGLTLQNNGGAPIRVTFITDTGIDEHIVSLDGADTDDFSPASLKSIILHPCIRSYERFGVRLECDGPLAVDGMTLTYRILGGVR